MSRSINDFVEPQSIKNFTLISGKVIKNSSLVFLTEIISGAMSHAFRKSPCKNLDLVHRNIGVQGVPR